MPYAVEIYRTDINRLVKTCTSGTACAYSGRADWPQNANPAPHMYKAKLVWNTMSHEGAPAVSASVDIRPLDLTIGLSAQPSATRVDDTYEVRATPSRDLSTMPYNVEIYRTDINRLVKTCYDGPVCTYQGRPDWPENPNPKPHNFEARLVYNGHIAASAQTKVDVIPFPVSLDVAANPKSPRVGDDYEVRATPSRDLSTMPYNVEIVRTDINRVVKTCYDGTVCTYQGRPDWPLNVDPKPLPFAARLIYSGHQAASAETSVDVRRRLYDVDLSFQPAGSGQDAITTLNESMSLNPYSLYIRDAGNNAIKAQCADGTECRAYGLPVGGSYRATVEDGYGHIFGASAAFRLTADGPENLTEDDLDLAALATHYSSGRAVCDAVLVAPIKTYVMQPASSVHDQSRVCEAQLAQGKALTDILRLVGLAGGGTAILWWLQHDATRRALDPPATPSAPEWDETNAPSKDDNQPPKAGPLLSYSTEVEELATELEVKNPELNRVQVRQAARQCVWAVGQHANAARRCIDLPIFLTGVDAADARDHDHTALRSLPIPHRWQWLRLNREQSSTKDRPPGWANLEAECAGKTDPGVIACDEYPFFGTEQGGPLAQASGYPRPHLEPIDWSDNSLQGTRYSQFISDNFNQSLSPPLRGCNLATGTPRQGQNSTGGAPFLAIPQHRRASLPTFWVCND